MGKEIVLFESEEQMTLDDVAAFLHELADQLAGNEVVLQKEGDSVTLQIPDRVVLEVEAEEEVDDGRRERSLEIELEWYVDEQAVESESVAEGVEGEEAT